MKENSHTHIADHIAVLCVQASIEVNNTSRVVSSHVSFFLSFSVFPCRTGNIVGEEESCILARVLHMQRTGHVGAIGIS